MTIQFPQLEVNEPRLLTDSYAQFNSDNSFDDKLKLEQARLGLMYSPFSQLQSIFASTLNFDFNTDKLAGELNSQSTTSTAENSDNYQEPTGTNKTYSTDNKTFPPLSDSLPLQSVNKQSLQQLLLQTGWLMPNLEAAPAFAQAFSAGKLQPTFDMQSLIDQIINQVKLVKDKGKTELTLTLKPDELGDILLTLTSHSGQVSIQIQASAETRKLIDSERTELERALKKARVNFDTIQVQEVKKHA